MSSSTQLPEKIRFALRRPDLLMRKLRGLQPSEITLDEVARYVPDHPVVIEAGAADGRDTAEFVRRWPGCEVHAFEPVPSAMAKVEQLTAAMPEVRRYPVALADRTGTMTMYLSDRTDDPGCTDSSSLLAPTGHLEAFPEVVFGAELQVPTTTMDAWLEAHPLPRIDLMWLDMQGAELAALEAGPRTLARTGAVLMEVSRKPLYAGAPLYDEVLRWLRGQGFRPVIDRVPVVFGNVLFVR
ncbi:FkbM family methyltransferase [Blastococcus sp. SYSU D00813]